MEFTVTTEIPAKAEDIYVAWLDSDLHAAMTAADSAVASQEIGASHQAHGNYISGKNIELVPNQKIVQSWRTVEFAADDEDSLIEVSLEEEGRYTKITLRHSNLPENGGHYEQGWIDHYFTPMQDYFSNLNS